MELTFTGKESGDIIVFVHGWPDSSTLWEKQMKAFGETHCCLALTLPNFGQHIKAEGYTFLEVAMAIKNTVDSFVAKRQLHNRKIILCAHDWGCLFGYILDSLHPGFFSQMICLDVGASFCPTLKDMFLTFCYQFVLIVAFLIGGGLGDWLAQFVASFVGAPLAKNKETLCRVKSYMGYPYYYLWEEFIWKKQSILALLHSYGPSCPMLFMYGTKTPINFFDEKWLGRVEATLGSKIAAIDSDHWFLVHWADRVVQEMQLFLQSKPKTDEICLSR